MSLLRSTLRKIFLNLSQRETMIGNVNETIDSTDCICIDAVGIWSTVFNPEESPITERGRKAAEV